jgi:hypothetical protein
MSSEREVDGGEDMGGGARIMARAFMLFAEILCKGNGWTSITVDPSLKRRLDLCAACAIESLNLTIIMMDSQYMLVDAEGAFEDSQGAYMKSQGAFFEGETQPIAYDPVLHAPLPIVHPKRQEFQ